MLVTIFIFVISCIYYLGTPYVVGLLLITYCNPKWILKSDYHDILNVLLYTS